MLSRIPKLAKIRGLAIALLCCPLILAALYWATFPFADQIGTESLSISSLTAAQKANIRTAAQSLDGVVLAPGQIFSFNKIVGPRTLGRGYRSAPSYLGAENIATLGGGVCLMSSLLYHLALDVGCPIVERVPHLRTIKTVPAGLDATVWYGQSDLRFKNRFSYPIQLQTAINSQTVSISILGRRNANVALVQLQRLVTRRADHQIVVELLARQRTGDTLISRDLYTVAQ